MSEVISAYALSRKFKNRRNKAARKANGGNARRSARRAKAKALAAAK